MAGALCLLFAVAVAAAAPAEGARGDRVPEADSRSGGQRTAVRVRSDSGNSERDLTWENDALRRENQKLRRELVRQRTGEPVIDMSDDGNQGGAKETAVREKIVDDGGWWLSSTGKRHNSKCRHYKMGRGRPCGKGEGVPCGKCGG